MGLVNIITAGIRNKEYSTDLVNLCYIRTSNSVQNTMQWIIYYYLKINEWSPKFEVLSRKLKIPFDSGNSTCSVPYPHPGNEWE